MLDATGEIIYVGKASNLRNRVRSYFRGSHGPKTTVLVRQITGIEVTVTHTEAEALILEHSLIKQHRPRYNIMLRDDKSYPYVHINTTAEFPRIAFHRGAQRGGRYFGPYPSAQAVRSSLGELQRLFQLRPCPDSTFKNRSRPCLQHQIGRCSAPCVGLITAEDYERDVEQAMQFLQGNSSAVIDELVQRMEKAAAELDFERAAQNRDRIGWLRKISQKQYVDGETAVDADVLAIKLEGDIAAVAVLFIRGGRTLGQETQFPKLPADITPEEFLTEFLARFYLERAAPAELILPLAPNDKTVLQKAIAERAGRSVQLKTGVRGERRKWLEMAEQSLGQAQATRQVSSATARQQRAALQDALQLSDAPARMECFDISHTMGEATVASCVVFDAEGPRKSDYRRFNISGITPGDDYAAMKQAVTRRYQRLQAGEAALPDILFIDGGKGQLSQARDVMAELGVVGVTLVGVAKGPERKAGLEQLFIDDDPTPVRMEENSPALHLIQQIRDEAHRFAIAGHRARRGKARTRSTLEDINGLGPKRRSQLMKQFGGIQGISRASVDDLAAVEGVSAKLAQRIYDTFHGD